MGGGGGLIDLFHKWRAKLAFLASSTCVKIIEFSLENEARKAYLHEHKRIIIMPAIYERGPFSQFTLFQCTTV